MNRYLLALIGMGLAAAEAIALAPDEETVLRSRLLGPAPANATREFWEERYNAAKKLGDQALLRKVVDQALLALPSDRTAQNFFLSQLWSVLRNSAPPREHLPVGEEMVRRQPNSAGYRFILSRNYITIQNFERAEQLLKEGEAIAKTKPNDLTEQNQYRVTQASLAQNLGRLDEAVKFIKISIEIVDKRALQLKSDDRNRVSFLADQIQQRTTLTNLYIRLGDYAAAHAVMLECRQLAKQQNLGGTYLAPLRRNAALISLAEGDFARALPGLDEAALLLQQSGVDATHDSLINIDKYRLSAFLGLGRYADALAISQKLRGLRNQDTLLIRLAGSGAEEALAYWKSGDLPNALGRIRAAVANSDARYGPQHYLSLRNRALLNAIQLQQSFDPALFQDFEQTIAKLLAPQTAMPGQAIEQLLQQMIFESYLAQLAAREVKPAASLDLAFQIANHLQQSVVGKVVAEAARRSVLSQPELGDLVSRQQKIKFELSAAYDNLASALAQSKADRDEKVIGALHSSMQSLQDEQLQIERSIASKYPHYNQLASGVSVSLPEVTRMLSRDEVLVHFLPTAEKTYAWALARGKPAFFYVVAINDATLRDRVLSLRKTLDIGDKPQSQTPILDVDSAQFLYGALLSPAKEIMSGRSNLIVSTSGILGQIPFSVLLTDAPSPQAMPWLIRSHAVTHLSSIGAFSALRQSTYRDAASKAFIGFADPQFNRQGGKVTAGTTRNLGLQRVAPSADPDALQAALQNYAQLPALPETRDETLAMAAALGADPGQDIFLGKAATRVAVLKAPLINYQVVSFSTHGLVAGDLPGLNQPALAMAASDQEGESPLLTLEDVLKLKLNADWVVLSACNTAAADGEASEALSGLGRGFFYAGARALLVTHWAVESESAKQLVTETFKRYGADKSLSRAEALRRAQLQLIDGKRYSHPFYWAPYALVGDGGL